MIATLNGQPIYRLTFHHDQCGTHTKKNHKGKKVQIKLNCTTALVFIWNGTKDEPPVAKATVKQHHKDVFNREYARKAALRKLLSPQGTFNRNERASIWKAYFDRTKQVKKPNPPRGGAGAVVAFPRQANTHAVVNRLVA